MADTRVIVNGMVSRGVRSAEIEDGQLVLVLTDGRRISLGKIVPEKGVDYFDGYSPTVESSRSDDIVTITITDADGPHTFNIYDGISPSVQGSKSGETTTLVVIDRMARREYEILDGISITGAEVDGAGNLVLYRSRGEALNAGYVMGHLSPDDRKTIEDAFSAASAAKSASEEAEQTAGMAASVASSAVSTAETAANVAANAYQMANEAVNAATRSEAYASSARNAAAASAENAEAAAASAEEARESAAAAEERAAAADGFGLITLIDRHAAAVTPGTEALDTSAVHYKRFPEALAAGKTAILEVVCSEDGIAQLMAGTQMTASQLVDTIVSGHSVEAGRPFYVTYTPSGSYSYFRLLLQGNKMVPWSLRLMDVTQNGGLNTEQTQRLASAVAFGDVYSPEQQAEIQRMLGIYPSEGVGF